MDVTTRTRRRVAAVLLLLIVATASVAATDGDREPAPADVAVSDVDRVQESAGTVYLVDYKPGLAMRLDALLFGSDDLERALLRHVGASENARFRRLTMDRAVLVDE